ncbi:hypothetical protein HYY75_12240 [bacterium]|nr:hypothetical protein [bacterium]
MKVLEKTDGGISLVEILIALTLLTALSIPVVTIFSAGTRGIQITSEEFIAHTAAIELLEQLMSAPFRFLPVGTFTDAQIKNGEPFDSSTPWKYRISENQNLIREVKISELKRNGKTRFKKIEVKIRWVPKEGKEAIRSVTLKSLLANEN